MKQAKDLIPWDVKDISQRPYEGMWSMNPSIHFDGDVWRCVLRCCDYAMPNGVTIRSDKSRPAGNQTKNAMLILDPRTWQPVRIFKMHERDRHPRAPCANVGYEDMRIFRTDRGGLQGIAASLHLERERRVNVEGSAQHQPPEQVLLSFDPEYNIVDARPIRGDWWSGTPQKNWVPFDNAIEPRFLYSINKGTLFGDHGALHGDASRVQPSPRASVAGLTIVMAPEAEPPSQPQPQPQPSPPAREAPRPHADRRVVAGRRSTVRSAEVQMVRGRKISADTLSTRPSRVSASSSAATATTRHGTRGAGDSTRMLGTGRALPPKYEGLRGGGQLIRVSDDAWLGIAHEMRFVKSLKYYWHVWYLVDGRGKMLATSDPMKLATNGIEFAAGMALDGDRLVVSFGVDDMHCRLGETRLSAVMGLLHSTGG